MAAWVVSLYSRFSHCQGVAETGNAAADYEEVRCYLHMGDGL